MKFVAKGRSSINLKNQLEKQEYLSGGGFEQDSDPSPLFCLQHRLLADSSSQIF